MIIDNRPINKYAKHRGSFKYLTEPTEFEIQSYLFSSLTTMGYHVRGEMAVFGHKARFDLVIFEHKKCSGTGCKYRPLRIIEVKRSRTAKRLTKTNVQLDGYHDRFGIPIDSIYGMGEANRYLKEIPLVVSATT
jgi:hypothetical protein